MALIDADALEREVAAARARGLDRSPPDLLRWAFELLGDKLMMTTAFQKGGMVLLHMARAIAPGLPVFFLDTGFHFPETMEFIAKLRREWKINLILQRGRVHGEAFKAQFGNLYESDPDLCCHKNKTEPMAELLERHQGWITAVRRDQASTRANAEPLEILEGAKLKVQPLAYWSRAQVDAYLAEHDVPLHPLFSQGYTSIGCAPCTERPIDPSDERSGRWVKFGKKECGLHFMGKPAPKEPGSEAGRSNKLSLPPAGSPGPMPPGTLSRSA